MEDKTQEINEQYENMPKRPILTTLAGVVWTVFGILGLLLAIFFLITFLMTIFGETGFDFPFILKVVAIPAIFGVVVTYVGMQTIRGKASDVIVPSIGSILIGVFYFFVVIQDDSQTDDQFRVKTLFIAVMLLAAGILALIERKQYKVWRNARIQKEEDSKLGK